MKGTVKMFNKEKGYGFIRGEDGKDYFFHYSVLVMDDFKTAYYSKTVWSGDAVESTGFVKCTVSDTSDKKHLLSFPNGETMLFYYDEGELWLQMENGTYHLLKCERFDIQQDLRW